ncbi:MIT domain-containing protein 1-like [Bradysia coprophila]|uniref:MIT domain-containing protein 1-like n=1 Tax=Bradysia coprophila TaxID=38358 RepID=UPI00187D97B7|nr:MIT domain-containing protein 1-like [Bradysia coprophila]
MSAVELLQKAVRLDTSGRMLEALKLYQSGIDELLKICKIEEDAAKKLRYQDKLKEYMTRAEQIKELYKSQISKGQIVDKRHIIENSTGNSYESVFGKYLKDDVTEISLDEPYIREHYQLVNLVKFCELVVLKCRNLRYIHVTTSKDARDNSDQTKAFASLVKSLKSRAITMNIEFSDHIHDRQIILNNGYVIKIGRGLNYFKPTASRFELGCFDYEMRECKETNVDVFFCPENKN